MKLWYIVLAAFACNGHAARIAFTDDLQLNDFGRQVHGLISEHEMLMLWAVNKVHTESLSEKSNSIKLDDGIRISYQQHGIKQAMLADGVFEKKLVYRVELIEELAQGETHLEASMPPKRCFLYTFIARYKKDELHPVDSESTESLGLWIVDTSVVPKSGCTCLSSPLCLKRLCHNIPRLHTYLTAIAFILSLQLFGLLISHGNS